MRRIVRVLAVVFSLPVSLGAIGLAGGDSYPGLRAMRPPLRITWTVDAVTVGQLGGAPGFAALAGNGVLSKTSHLYFRLTNSGMAFLPVGIN